MKNTTTVFVALIALILIIGTGTYAYLHMQAAQPAGTATVADATVATYSCAQGPLNVSFSKERASITLPDGTLLTLPQAVSGSGFRYESGTSVFIGKGSDATLTQDGLVTFGNCIAGTNASTGTSGDTNVGMKMFTDTGKTFSFTYPGMFTVTGSGAGYTTDWSTGSSVLGLTLAQVMISRSFQPNTNFSDAKFSAGTSADPGAVKKCLTADSGGTIKSEKVTINGTSYTKLTYGDAAAGNRYDTTSYRTVRDNQCYAIEYTIHYGNIQNYSSDSGITEFDEAKVQGVLDAIARSFRFL